MGQECLFLSAGPCYCSFISINTVQEKWIFSGLKPGWWKTPLPWALSLVHRAVAWPFLMGLTNRRGGLGRDVQDCWTLEGKEGWWAIIPWFEQWAALCSRHCTRHMACAILLLLTTTLWGKHQRLQNPGRWRGSLRVCSFPTSEPGITAFQTLGVSMLSAIRRTWEQGLSSKKCSYLCSVSMRTRSGRVLRVDFSL